MRPLRHVFGIAAFALFGCSTFLPVETLKGQASYDLRCPEDKLLFTPLSGDCEGKKIGNVYDCTYGVRCGDQQATYIHVRGSNTWVMNTASNPK